MRQKIRAAWALPELRHKILFVIFALLIFRVGAAVPVPYINTEYLQQFFAALSESPIRAAAQKLELKFARKNMQVSMRIEMFVLP